MTNRSARAIRKALDLPRLPSEMTRNQRWLYRWVKRHYTRLPAPRKGVYLDSPAAIKQQASTPA